MDARKVSLHHHALWIPTGQRSKSYLFGKDYAVSRWDTRSRFLCTWRKYLGIPVGWRIWGSLRLVNHKYLFWPNCLHRCFPNLTKYYHPPRKNRKTQNQWYGHALDTATITIAAIAVLIQTEALVIFSIQILQQPSCLLQKLQRSAVAHPRTAILMACCEPTNCSRKSEGYQLTWEKWRNADGWEQSFECPVPSSWMFWTKHSLDVSELPRVFRSLSCTVLPCWGSTRINHLVPSYMMNTC